MMRSSRTDALDLMRAANPVSAAELRAAIDEADLVRAMHRAIVVGESPARPIPAGDRIALLVVLGGGSVDSVKDGGRPTYAAAAVKVAEANPRLLVTAPGWSIVHAHSFEVDSGILEYRYRHTAAYGLGAHLLHLSWSPARYYRTTLRGHRGAGTVETSTVLGRPATTFHEYQRGTSDYWTILPPQGKVFVEINASLSPPEYATVLRSLRAVSVDRWLAAMPAEVVQPAARSAVIARMLDGVPLPPDFQLSPLEAETHFTDRFELGRAVAGAVACGWLESWSAATRSGDDDAAQQAVAGMAGARRWPVLLQMVQEKGFEGDVLPAHGNGWPSYVVEAAREIGDGHLRRLPAVRTIRDSEGNIAGVMTPRNAAPVSALGCHFGG